MLLFYHFANYNRLMPLRTGRFFVYSIPADLWMIIVVLLWGLNFVIMKNALLEIPPPLFVTLRFSAGSLLMLAILRYQHGPISLPKRDYKQLILLGLIGNAAYQSMFIWGLKYTSAANGSLIINATPIVVGFLGALWGIERMRLGLALALLLGFTGVLIVLLPNRSSVSAMNFQGDLLMVGSMLSWAIYTLGVRRYATGMDPIYLTTWTIVFGTLCLVIFNGMSVFEAQWSLYSFAAWFGLAYSIIGSLIISYLLWNMSVQRVGGVRTTIYISMIPLVAALSAWVALGEAITVYHLLGGILIFFSVRLAQRTA